MPNTVQLHSWSVISCKVLHTTCFVHDKYEGANKRKFKLTQIFNLVNFRISKNQNTVILPVLLVAVFFEHDGGVVGGVPGICCINNNIQCR